MEFELTKEKLIFKNDSNKEQPLADGGVKIPSGWCTALRRSDQLRFKMTLNADLPTSPVLPVPTENWLMLTPSGLYLMAAGTLECYLDVVSSNVEVFQTMAGNQFEPVAMFAWPTNHASGHVFLPKRWFQNDDWSNPKAQELGLAILPIYPSPEFRISKPEKSPRRTRYLRPLFKRADYEALATSLKTSLTEFLQEFQFPYLLCKEDSLTKDTTHNYRAELPGASPPPDKCQFQEISVGQRFWIEAKQTKPDDREPGKRHTRCQLVDDSGKVRSGYVFNEHHQFSSYNPIFLPGSVLKQGANLLPLAGSDHEPLTMGEVLLNTLWGLSLTPRAHFASEPKRGDLTLVRLEFVGQPLGALAALPPSLLTLERSLLLMDFFDAANSNSAEELLASKFCSRLAEVYTIGVEVAGSLASLPVKFEPGMATFAEHMDRLATLLEAAWDWRADGVVLALRPGS